MLSQQQRDRRQFYKNSKWKRLTQVEIVYFPICLIQRPGGNLGQREIQIEFETVRWGFVIK